MKYLYLNQLISSNYNISLHKKNKWGRQQINNIIGWCKLHNYVIIDIVSIFFNIKNIINIINYISTKLGISLLCLLSDSNIINTSLKRVKIKNFYMVYLDKIYGFISNFYMFIKKGRKHYKNIVNYRSKRLPDIVFMSKDSWKDYNNFFKIFLEYKILSIKNTSFLEKDIHICYNIMVNNSLIIYNLWKYIYKQNRILFKKC